MKSIEMSGKTVEDAVKAGLKQLGKESSDVTIDVLEYGSPGLFGMFGRLAKVRLTVKEADPELDFEMPVFSLDQQPAKKAKPQPTQPVKPKTPPKAEEKPAREEKTDKPREEIKREQKPAAEDKTAPVQESAPQASAEKAPKAPRPPRPPRPPREKKPRPEAAPADVRPQPPMEPASMEDLPKTDPESLQETGKIAYDFLSQLTTLMNVPVEIRVKEEEGHISAQMIGDTLGVLIGRRGDTLDALQYLTSLQVNKGREEYVRVTLDTEHYRAKREDALRKLAERMANRVRKTGHRVALEPMNPYERRVLHSALQANPYVTTHSEGEEPYRRVIITPK